MNVIDISGLDKGQVLKSLWEHSRPQGMSVLHEQEPTPDQCAAAAGRYVDYFSGRVVKCDLTGDYFDPRLFDRANGQGAAQRAVDALLAA